MNKQLTGIAAACLLLVLLAPAPAAVADAPDVRGPEVLPTGGTGGAGTVGWAGVEPLPPITGVPEPSTAQISAAEAWSDAGVPPAIVYGQAPEGTFATAAFSLRALNPGNWVLDAGLGIVSATMQSIQQTLLGFVTAVSGASPPDAQSNAIAGCEGGMELLFCTKPEQLLPAYDLIGPQDDPIQGKLPTALHNIWLALQPAALALLTLVFTVRLGRVMYAGPAAFQAEVKALLLPFVGACLMVAAAPALLRTLLILFAALNRAILSRGVFGGSVLEIPFLTYIPTGFAASMALGPATAVLALYVVLFIAFVVAIVRLAKLALLFALAPLAGATLIDHSTAHFFRGWISRVLELLLQQFGWSVAVLVGSAILKTVLPDQVDRPTNEAAFVLHTMGTALILLLMLNHQQLFSGVFSLVAGAPVAAGGDLLGKTASAFAVADGVVRARSIWRDRAVSGVAPRGAAPRNPAAPRGAGSPGTQATPPSRLQSAGATRHWNAGRLATAAAPGARARAATATRGQSVAATPSVAQLVHAKPTRVAAGSATYIAAGRVPRPDAPTHSVLPVAAVPAATRRAVILSHLQAQASQTGRQAWRAAPAAFAQQARWRSHVASSVAGQRALHSIGRRPDVARRNVAGGSRRPERDAR